MDQVDTAEECQPHGLLCQHSSHARLLDVAKNIHVDNYFQAVFALVLGKILGSLNILWRIVSFMDQDSNSLAKIAKYPCTEKSGAGVLVIHFCDVGSSKRLDQNTFLGPRG